MRSFFVHCTFEFVKEEVYPKRKNVSRKNHRVYWWIHAESRPGMRLALENLNRYIGTPRVKASGLHLDSI